MICPACHKDVQPYEDMGTDMRITSRCPVSDCNAAFPRDVAASPPAMVKSTVASAIAKPTPQPHTLDVLALAKARLEALDAELASFEAKLVEASMLRRMIAAAESASDPDGMPLHS